MELPTVLADRYEVLGLLGQGAMGRVYRVRDRAGGAVVALKVLTAAEAKGQLLLQQEFRLMTRLRHPNCCAVYDYGTLAGGEPYFTMELVPGRGLDELGVLDADAFRDLFPQLLRALGYVHAAGFVHRDVKAANVRVTDDGTLKLMDYGLMTFAGRQDLPIAGTLATMAPEVIRRGPVDGRADLYSAGCLAYEVLAGNAPFERATPVAVLRAHVAEEAVPLAFARPDLDLATIALISGLMEKEPGDRPASAGAALAALGVSSPGGLGGALVAAPLVGREEELARLSARLDAVVVGEPGGVVVLAGAPGAGKSRLADELRVRAQLAELPCAAAGPGPTPDLPYAPVVAFLRMWLPALRAHAAVALAKAAPALGELLPELVTPRKLAGPRAATGPLPAGAGQAVGDGVPVPDEDLLAGADGPTDLQAARARLHQAVIGLVTALAAATPLVLVLDDWQWADPLSRELVDALATALHDAPLLLVIATRATVDEADVPAGAEAIAVVPLAGAALARMVQAMLGAEPPAGLLPLVDDLAHGNPFHVERLLLHLVRHGRLVARGMNWELLEATGGSAPPRNLDALLEAAFADLPAGARALARAASVLGDGADLEVLAAVAGLDEATLLAAREDLAKARIGAVDEGGRFTFAADRFAETLSGGMAPAERSALHGRAARALADRMAAAEKARGQAADGTGRWPLAPLAAAARHALRAADAELAIPLGLAAGRRLLALYALDDAAALLEPGLALARQAGQAGRKDVLAYLMALERAYFFGRKLDAAIAASDEARRLAAALGDDGTVVDAWLAGGQAKFNAEDVNGALAAYGEALAIATRIGDDSRAAQALMRRGVAMSFDGRYAHACADLEGALKLADPERDRGLVAGAWSALGYFYVLRSPERSAEGHAMVERAVEAFRRLGDPWHLCHALSRAGDVRALAGRLDAAREAFDEALLLADASGILGERLYARGNSAWVEVLLGNWRAAARHAAEGAAWAEPIGFAHPRSLCLAHGALAELGLGRPAAALVLLDQAQDLARTAGMPYLKMLVAGYEVEIAARIGLSARAEAAAIALAPFHPNGGYPEEEGRATAHLAAARVLTGDLKAAETAWRTANALAAASRGVEARIVAALAGARLAVAAEGWEQAQERALLALKLATDAGFRGLAAEADGIQGEVALARGDARAAEAAFAAMAETAAALASSAALAVARFGQAAAAPYAPEALGHVAEARTLLEATCTGLDAEARTAWLAVPERARIVEGNHVAFSLARTSRPGTRPFGMQFPDRL